MEPTKQESGLGVEHLQAQVAICAELGREAREKTRSTRGRDRYDAWNDKRVEGQEARHALLALAFFRGKPYRHAEPEVQNTPVVSWLVGRLARALYPEAIAKNPKELVGLRSEVEAWLAVPETQERKAWRLVRIQRGQARRDARRVQHREVRRGTGT